MITIEQIEKGIKILEAIKGDHEAAHSLEDLILAATLQSIAGGYHDADGARALAQSALCVKDVTFPRGRKL